MPARSPPNVQAQLAAALDHLNRGDVDAAARVCAGLRAVAGEHPATLQLEATIALRAGRPAAARDSIRRALALRPGHVPSLILLCRALLDLNDPTLDTALTEAAARPPANAADWRHLGQALLRAARPALALVAFDRAAAADPAAGEAPFGRGLALRDLGRMAAARAVLQRAVALAPDSGGAWFALGLTCQDLSDEAAAAEAFAAALAARPTLAEAAVNLGIARQRLGDMDGAIAAYRQAVAIRPDTFGRIAQAVCAARTGVLFIDPAALRRLLGA